jgi:predicted Zn-dependent protease with MMP-like domain
MPGRKLAEGTIAIQGHDPKSVTLYKDLFIKALP